MKRYPDCSNEGCICEECSLSSRGMDCHNNPSNPLAYLRTKSGMTLQQLADIVGKQKGRICDIEKGRIKLENITLSTAIKLADAFGLSDLRELLI